MGTPDTSQPDEQARKAIEQRIVSCTKHFLLRPDVECFNDDAVQEFLEAWRDLAQYYMEYNDTMINIEAIREHRAWTGVFGGMAQNETLSKECREEADEVYKELEIRMDDIIVMNVRWLYLGGR